ncbi:MAG TPA: ferritin Dps family protein [Gammaproteobacteria bacterium]
MEKQTYPGANRTGIDMSPIHSKEMISGAQKLTVVQSVGTEQRERIERQYLDQAEPVGSVPLPGTLKGAFKSTMEKAAGRNPEVFVNKLGQRLAFERTGTRLYEAVIRKCEALSAMGETLPFALDEIEHLRAEELQHFQLLNQCLLEIGADPTALTPDADISAVAAMGYQRALSDPRTTLPQSLQLLVPAGREDGGRRRPQDAALEDGARERRQRRLSRVPFTAPR